MEHIKKYHLPVTLTGFVIVLMACNLHLFHGSSPSSLVFKKELVAAGEWWRVATHLFVHVSWYHLLLDGVAVALLWHEIDLAPSIKKIFVALLCAASSLLIAVWFSPVIEYSGYCGLSGLAHGLMLFLGLSWTRQAFPAGRRGFVDRRRLAAGSLLVLLSGGKSIVEVITGSVLFSQFHLGDLGLPVVQAHLGGAIGGLSAFIFLTLTGAKKHDLGYYRGRQ